MELLETTDPQKKKLIEASARHKRELEKEVKSITSTTEKALTNALFIGGALALAYIAYSQIAGGKSKKKKAKRQKEKDEEFDETTEKAETSSSFLSHVGEIVVTQATMVILEMAREQLASYLESRKSSDENS